MRMEKGMESDRKFGNAMGTVRGVGNGSGSLVQFPIKRAGGAHDCATAPSLPFR